MRSRTRKTFDARTRERWRAWLARHHDSETEVWLVFYKRHTGHPSIDHTEALDEALCFGWIDSLVTRLDDDRYLIKFTPRKPDSRWSAINRKRYAELEAAGRLMPAGVARPPTRGYPARTRTSWTTVPVYIERAMKRRPAAWTFFQTLAPSYRRMYVGWIDSARQEATKTRRLEEALDLLEAGRKLGLK